MWGNCVPMLYDKKKGGFVENDCEFRIKQWHI